MRRAEPSDAGGVARVWCAAWGSDFRGLIADELLDSISLAERRETWRGRLAQPDPAAPTLVAASGEEVLGYCRAILPSRDPDAGRLTAEIANLYVSPEHRREGVGRALLAATTALLRSEDWLELTLWVFRGNHAARRFYAQIGFTPDGTRRFDYGAGVEEERLRLAFEHLRIARRRAQ